MSAPLKCGTTRRSHYQLNTTSSKLWWYLITFTYSTIFRANWVRVNGTKYDTPRLLVFGKTDEDKLLFGEVTRILVDIKSVFFNFSSLSHTSTITFIVIV